MANGFEENDPIPEIYKQFFEDRNEDMGAQPAPDPIPEIYKQFFDPSVTRSIIKNRFTVAQMGPDPDQVGRDIELSKAAGLPRTAGAAIADDLLGRDVDQKLEAVLRNDRMNSPLAELIARDPDMAAVVGVEDLESLFKLQDSLQRIPPAEREPPVGKLRAGWWTGELMVRISDIRSNQAFSNLLGTEPPTFMEMAEVDHQAEQMATVHSFHPDPEGWGHVLDVPAAIAEQGPNFLEQGKAQMVGGVSAGLVAGTVGAGVGFATPVPGGTAAGAVTGFSWGWWAGGSASRWWVATRLESGMILQDMYAENARMRAEDPSVPLLDPTDESASAIALVLGSVAGSLEFMGYGLIKKTFGLKGMFSKTGREMLRKATKSEVYRNAIKAWAKGMVGEGSTEYLQEGLAIFAGEFQKAWELRFQDAEGSTTERLRAATLAALDDTFSNPETWNRMGAAFVEGFKVGGGMGAAGSGVRVGLQLRGRNVQEQQLEVDLRHVSDTSSSVTEDVVAAVEGEEDAEVIEDLVEKTGESKLNQRSPSKFAQLVKQAAERTGESGTVWITFGKFKGYFDALAERTGEVGLQAENIARELGIEAEYREAEATGADADMQIPVEVYLSKLSQTDHHKALADHMRLRLEAKTPSETREFLAQVKKVLAGDANDVDLLSGIDAEFTAYAQAITDDVTAQMDAAGHFKTDVSRKYGQLMASFFVTMGKRLNKNPLELYKEQGLVIESDLTERQKFDGRVLAQPAIVAAAIRAIDKDGKEHFFQGRNHGEALDAAHDALGDSFIMTPDDEGFMTDDGRFLNRDQAAEETGVKSQDPGFMTSEDMDEAGEPIDSAEPGRVLGQPTVVITTTGLKVLSGRTEVRGREDVDSKTLKKLRAELKKLILNSTDETKKKYGLDNLPEKLNARALFHAAKELASIYHNMKIEDRPGLPAKERRLFAAARRLLRKRSVLEIAEYFDSRYRGERIDHRDATSKQNRVLENRMFDEALYALDLHPEAVGWYRENVRLAMSILEELTDGEIKKPENLIIFQLIVAISSNGNDTGPNFNMAVKEYLRWTDTLPKNLSRKDKAKYSKGTGKLDGRFIHGDKESTIIETLEMAKGLLDRVGHERMAEFLSRKGNAAELHAALVETFGLDDKEASFLVKKTGSLVSDVVPFSTIFGPKLGSFYINLNGDYSSTTFDLWFMRWIGRLSGTHVQEISKEARAARVTRFVKAAEAIPKKYLKKMGINVDDLRGKERVVNGKRVPGRPRPARIKEAAKKAERHFAKDEKNRENLSEKKNEFRLSANGYFAKDLQDTPASGGHRAWMRDRMAAVIERLDDAGIQIEPADLQAVLWYLEKELYYAFGQDKKSDADDYASAAEATYVELVGRPSRAYASGTGQVGTVGQRGGGRGGAAPTKLGQPVREEVAGERQLRGVFYSALARALRLSKKRKMSPEELLAYLKDLGVKKEEIFVSGIEEYLDWVGLQQWLASNPGTRPPGPPAVVNVDLDHLLDTLRLVDVTEKMLISQEVRNQMIEERAKEILEEAGDGLQAAMTDEEMINLGQENIDASNRQKQLWNELLDTMEEVGLLPDVLHPGSRYSVDRARTFADEWRSLAASEIEDSDDTGRLVEAIDAWQAAHKAWRDIDHRDLTSNLELDEARDQAAGEIRAVLDDTQFDRHTQYNIPGGENARELLIMIPMLGHPDAFMGATARDPGEFEIIENEDGAFDIWAGENDWVGERETRGEAQALVDEAQRLSPDRVDEWVKHHFGSQYPNLVVHVRVDERVVDGKRVLFIQEIQSDLHQKGRERGYRSSSKQEEVDGLKEDHHQSADRERKLWLRLLTVLEDHIPGAIDVPSRFDLIGSRLESSRLSDSPTALHFSRVREDFIWRVRGYVDGTTREDPRQVHHRSREMILEALDAWETEADVSVELAGQYVTAVGELKDAIPDAPFKDASWRELGFKRAIAYAAENGFEAVGWTTGLQQVSRYEEALRFVADEIKWEMRSIADTAERRITVMKDGEERWVFTVNAEGIITDPSPFGDTSGHADEMLGKHIRDVFGKEVADKIDLDMQPGDAGSISGEEFTVGGEFLRNLYDKDLTKIANRIGKDSGSKVSDIQLAGEDRMMPWLVMENGVVIDAFRSEDQAQANADDLAAQAAALGEESLISVEHDSEAQGEVVHSLPIPEKLRDSIVEHGQPLFQDDEGGTPRATIDLENSSRIVIRLGESADLSSFLHESWHLFMKVLEEQSARPGATEEIIGMWRTLRHELGVPETMGDLTAAFLDPEGDPDLRAQAEGFLEKLAEWGEQYLLEGKAPSKELAPLFAKFRAWIKAVYLQWERIFGKPLSETNPEVVTVFSKMLATDDEISRVTKGEEFQNDLDLFSPDELRRAGMTEAEVREHMEMIEEAKLEAEDILRAQELAEFSRRHKREFKRKKERIRAEIEKRLRATPWMQARMWLQTGVWIGEGEVPAAVLALGEGAKLDPEPIAEEFAGVTLPRGLTKDGGQNYELVAAAFGIDPSDLVNALRDSVSLNAQVKRMTDSRMQADLDALDDQIAENALEAAHNDLRGKLLANVLRITRRLENREPLRAGAGRVVAETGAGSAASRQQAIDEAKKVLADLENRKRTERPQRGSEEQQALQEELDSGVTQLRAAEEAQTAAINARRAERSALRSVRDIEGEVDAARERARELVRRTKIRDLRPSRFSTLERKAAKAFGRAVAKRDYAKAALAKADQMFAHYAYREARNAQESKDRWLRNLRRLIDDKARSAIGRGGQQFLAQLDDLLERFDLRRGAPSEKVALKKSLQAWADEQFEITGNEIRIPPAVELPGGPRHWSTLTVEEMDGVHDLARQIAHLGRNALKLRRDARKRTIEQAREVVLSTLDESHPDNYKPLPFEASWSERRRENMAEMNSKLTKMEFLYRLMDGRAVGPIWELFFKPMQESYEARLNMNQDYTERFQLLVSGHYTKSESKKWSKDQKFYPELLDRDGNPTRLSFANLLVMALNQGNSDNAQKLADGHNWKREDVMKVLDRELEQRDWDFVQGVLDMMKTLRPKLAAVERRVNGIEPKWVEAESIQTRHGTYEGGYYPIALDPLRAQQVGKDEASKRVQDIFSRQMRQPMTVQGHAKARVKSHGIPMKLTLDVIPRHLNDLILDISHREALMQVNALVSDTEIYKRMTLAVGEHMVSAIRPWLMRIATEDRIDLRSGDKIWGGLRVGATANAMAFKVSTALAQFLGFLTSVNELSRQGKNGEVYMMRGLTTWFRRHGEPGDEQKRLTEWVRETSAFMKHRRATFDRDVRDALQRVQGNGIKTEVSRHLFWLTAMADQAVSMSTWMGAYAQAMDGNARGIEMGDTVRAIAYADQIVRTSQGSGGAINLAEVQTGGELNKLATMFYSYFSVLYNLTAERLHMTKRDRGIRRFKAVADALYLYILPSVLGELLAGRGPDDDEEWLEWAIDAELSYLAAPLPYARDVADVIIRDRGYDFTPAGDFFEAVGEIGNDVYDGELDLRDSGLYRDMATVVGIGFRLPGRQSYITLETMYDMAYSNNGANAIDLALYRKRD